MIDLTTDFGRAVEQHLKNEYVIWLTTVDPHLTPQPRPVWFIWDGESVLIFSKPDAYKVKHIEHHPRVALHFNTDETGDKHVRLARSARLPVERCDWILEGGAIVGDGTGTVLTTEQCLLNPNRNAGIDRAEVEKKLHADLGFERVVWLGEGLATDHTDGHVDNLARYIAPGRVALPMPTADDPNAEVYRDAARRLKAARLDMVNLPSPGRVERDGEVIPASYMNFFIGNAAVVVPQYGAPNDQGALDVIQAFFPDRKAIGLRADHVLTGGGSFHCISQQVPA